MIEDHLFISEAMLGINPPPETQCIACGLPRREHRWSCSGILSLKGEHFECDLVSPHTGWGHSNKDAQAIWGER